MTYIIQISIPTLDFFTTETFTDEDAMLARYSDLISQQCDGVEIECMVK